MGKILELPKQVVDMIAAGEVIERPASVVRELVENALDAGARRIDIRAEGGGKDRIAVTDDGEGIDASDLPLAVLSHATSKLKDAEDLFGIRTLGFRGEALPSIGAVSRLKVTSRAAGADAGATLEVLGGEATPPKAVGCPDGTTVDVRKLFFNTPVRRRFLRRDATELAHITEQVALYALAHPSLHFRFTHEEKEILNAPPAGDLLKRIQDVEPKDRVRELKPVFHQDASLSLKAFVAPPTRSAPNAKSIRLFLNGRAIRDRLLLHAVIEAYRDSIPSGRYPVVYLFIALHPAEVDVNVHPAKIEVRFRNGGALHGRVTSLFRKALEGLDAPPPALTLRGEPAPRDVEQRSFPLHGGDAAAPPAQRVREALASYLETRDAPPPGDAPAGGPPAPAPLSASPTRPFLQVHRSYIVRETEEGLEIIDQHALAERVLYNEVRPRVARESIQAQRLLVPLTLDLDRSRVSLLEGNLDLFARFGLEINRFGPSTFAVQTTPPFLPDGEVAAFVEEVLSDLTGDAPAAPEKKLDTVAKRLACRGAVKAGQAMNEAEIRALLARTADLPRAVTCPHGRPAVVRITLAELEKNFQRR